MKNLFRIHFTAITVIDLLLFAFFSTRPEAALEWLLLSGFIFILAQGLLLFRLLIRLKHQFAEIYPQINKKIRFYYLGGSSATFYYLSSYPSLVLSDFPLLCQSSLLVILLYIIGQLTT